MNYEQARTTLTQWAQQALDSAPHPTTREFDNVTEADLEETAGLQVLVSVEFTGGAARALGGARTTTPGVLSFLILAPPGSGTRKALEVASHLSQSLRYRGSPGSLRMHAPVMGRSFEHRGWYARPLSFPFAVDD